MPKAHDKITKTILKVKSENIKLNIKNINNYYKILIQCKYKTDLKCYP